MHGGLEKHAKDEPWAVKMTLSRFRGVAFCPELLEVFDYQLPGMTGRTSLKSWGPGSG